MEGASCSLIDLIMKYKYLFGPVPSRRLGMSLGVDLIPHKTCSLNCIYCEAGRTLTLTTERGEWHPTDEIIAEIDDYLSKSPRLDIITFSGAGEPTLHVGFGRIAEYIRQKFPAYPLALLTNSVTMIDAQVRKELLYCSLVLPSLDAASQEVFQKINRPAKGVEIEAIIEGLVAFRKDFSSEIWLEVFLLQGVNDSADELSRLHDAISRIKPDRVQLNTLDRPGAVEWVKPMPKDEMQQIVSMWSDLPVEIIARFSLADRFMDEANDLDDRILGLIRRRPCTVEDISAALGVPEKELLGEIKEMIREHRIESQVLERGTFYKIPDF